MTQEEHFRCEAEGIVMGIPLIYTFEECLQQLRENGHIKMAELVETIYKERMGSNVSNPN